MLTFRQFLITILVIFSEYGLNFCISMAFPESMERTEVNLFSPWSSPNIRMQEEGDIQHAPERYLLPQMKSISLPVLGAETTSHQQINMYSRRSQVLRCSPHPFRSCRSSSKFNLPPPCRRLSEMSSTVFLLSFSLTSAF